MEECIKALLSPIVHIVKTERVELLKTTITAGAGTKEDPVRLIESYWDMDGTLCGVNDPAVALMLPGHPT